MRIVLFISLCLWGISSKAQYTDSLIQFSGLVMTSDSLRGLPYTNIYSKTTRRGTISDYKGFFSFVAQKGDIIIFESVGFKTKEFRIPSDFKDTKYSIIQLMTQDTFYLPETIIYPWGDKEGFKEAFVNFNVPDDDYERAKKNLDREAIREAGKDYKMDGNENQDYAFKQYNKQLYYSGQLHPDYMSVFSAGAWRKFIKAWQRGDFKKK